jgi:streptogrisin C
MAITPFSKATILGAAGLAAVLAVPTVALAGSDDRSGERSKAAAEPASLMAAAMSRDLGLTADQVTTRLKTEERARTIKDRLRKSLGADFGGAWLTGKGASPRLVVGVTDAAQAAKVRAAGAEPKTVARSERKLTGFKNRLDRAAKRAPKAVTGWYVDADTNKVVVRARPSGASAAKRFAAAGGVPASAVDVLKSDMRPRPLADLRGGEAYHINESARCSIGFSVEGGFVTAGHCGSVGDTTTGGNGEAQGEFAGSSFPGDDYAWVTTNENWTPKGVVLGEGGAEVPVAGSQEAAEGASICRSGSTTQWHCGTVEALDQTVSYPQGTVEGLTQTDVCAEPGDSGGSYISGDQAQGVTSGGSGNCSSGGTTFFQPVNEILEAGGLTLVTG